jgi:hypothetical protein
MTSDYGGGCYCRLRPASMPVSCGAAIRAKPEVRHLRALDGSQLYVESRGVATENKNRADYPSSESPLRSLSENKLCGSLCDLGVSVVDFL